jgi:hypothetical protein
MTPSTKTDTRLYEGFRCPDGGCRVIVVEPDRSTDRLSPRLDLERKSHTRSRGSGPARLTLDRVCGRTRRGVGGPSRFKRAFVGELGPRSILVDQPPRTCADTARDASPGAASLE